MIVKLIYNILDINDISFDTNINISATDYENMLNEKINENNTILHGFNGGNTIKKDMYYNHINNIENNTPEEKYIQIPCEANILLYDGSEINLNTLNDMVVSGKMYLLKVNINPNDLDYDAYSDLKQWISESNNIKNNNKINEKEKISILPSRKLGLDTNGKIFNLNNVKIIKDESNPNFPFNFIILIEKITL